MEIYKGVWSKGEKLLPDSQCGTLTIDNKNDILLEIHQSGPWNSDDCITGKVNGKYFYLYGNYLIDHGPGFFKFKCEYAVINLTFPKNIPCGIKNICSFKFTFKQLASWLNKDCYEFPNNNQIIVLDIPKIILLNSKELKIYVEYEESYKKNPETKNIISVEKIPYLKLEYNNPVDLNVIITDLKKVCRFFTLIIGRIENINKLYVVQDKAELQEPNEIIINQDFSYNYMLVSLYRYNTEFRVKYADIENEIQSFFNEWYKIYKKYELILNMFFNTENDYLIIEDRFLLYCKIIESYSQVNDISENKKIEKFEQDLINLYKTLKNTKIYDKIKSLYESNGINKKHINDIPKAISTNYRFRKNLENRLKEIDTKTFEVLERWNQKAYKNICSTRNYYTHLDKEGKEVFDSSQIIECNRILESMIICLLFKEMGFNQSDILSIMKNDSLYSSFYKDLKIE